MQAQTIEEAGYELHELLGEGRFSQVVRGTHAATGDDFAIKIVELSTLDEDEGALDALQVEIEVLQAAQHPHVVALHEVIETPSTTYVVMEVIGGGELFDEIVSRGMFPEHEARDLMKQLFEAIAFCHDIGVVHRDLKPENLLLDRSRSQLKLKLIDFGYAAFAREGELLSGLAGTPDYVAPEVLSWYDGEEQEGALYEREEYDASCDMWSAGVILYIMLCGFPPFYADSEEELIEVVRQVRSCA